MLHWATFKQLSNKPVIAYGSKVCVCITVMCLAQAHQQPTGTISRAQHPDQRKIYTATNFYAKTVNQKSTHKATAALSVHCPAAENHQQREHGKQAFPLGGRLARDGKVTSSSQLQRQHIEKMTHL